MKKIIYLIIVLGIVLLASLFSSAQALEINIFLDQQPLENIETSIMENDHLLIPARSIIEAMGGRITWFSALKLLNIYLEGQTASLVIDDPFLEVNGKKVALEISAKIINNRVMIPVEVIKIISQVEVTWDNQNKNLYFDTIKPNLLNIRSYSHPDKTRIVIDLSEATEFRASYLTDPERIYVDIMGSTGKLEEEAKQLEINDGVIKQVKTTQFNGEMARIAIGLFQKAEYETFSLLSPDRIVVDIFKPETKEAVLSEKITTSQPKEQPSVTIESGIAKKRVVVIDPGHGGSDPGAIGPTGLKEKEVTLGIAQALKELFNQAGIPVYLTREKDNLVYLEDRVNFANQKNGFVFVSIHTNSVLKHRPEATGIETYVLSSKYIGASAKDVADRENRASRMHPELDTDLAKIIADLEESANIQYSLDLAEIVQKEMVNYLKLGNRGVKQAPFVVLKGVNMAAILVEVGFISNPNEEKLLRDNNFRKKVAEAIFKALKYYLEKTPDEI